jgi:hypothetical protein
VWDAFASHKSEKTTKILKELGIEAAYVPGGCTKFIKVLLFSIYLLFSNLLFNLFRHLICAGINLSRRESATTTIYG